MPRRRSRLSRSKDFDRVYRAGRSVANRYLVLYYFRRSEAGDNGFAAASRVGFSVSKRLGSAVVRNRVKRVLREAFRLNESAVEDGWDFVLIARSPLTDLIEREGLSGAEGKVLEVFRKAGLISGDGDRSAK